MRRLVLILGDQLSLDNPALAGFDPRQDVVLMIEAHSESTTVWSSKPRIALFLSAMRHFAVEIGERGWPFVYVRLDDPLTGDFAERLAAAINEHRPASLTVCEPGEWRMLQLLQDTCAQSRCTLDLRADTHFMCSRAEFAGWAANRREFRLEHFYRWMRKRHDVLMADDGEPEGGQWNFDADNRKGFPKSGPGRIPEPALFAPDTITREVFALIEDEFGDHPGTLEDFVWPVTRAQALVALRCFIDERLEHFGPHQDAMWTGLPFGWHALLSSSMNLHLIHPREIIDAALAAWKERDLPLQSVEGFVRQVMGWREFIRGMYWTDMPGMREANHYGHARPLPKWYWTGECGMNCMREAIGQTLQYGFAHHIQRLMITGQFALLAEIAPREVSDWYLAVYVDAVEWVELPNVAGMALYADGGRFTSKPYIASGAYIQRMSNYCKGCRYDPSVRHGANACPVTTLYWNFLLRHEKTLAGNPRTALMAKNAGRLDDAERASIRIHAGTLLEHIDLV